MYKGEADVINSDDNNNNEDFINNYDNENNNNNNDNNNNKDEDDDIDNNDNKDRKRLRIKLLKLSSNQSTESALGYNETLMHGHYANLKLRTLLKHESEKWKRESSLKENLTRQESRLKIVRRTCSQLLTGRNLQDWIFLTFLGIAVAMFSFLIDLFTEKSLFAHRGLYGLLSGSMFGKFMAWVTYPLVFVAFSVGFTRLVGPTAIGSGIPEVKTIMKGVVLKEYLTFKTLVAKVIGLTTSLGSGLPLGKVGPFVHVASVTASNLSKLFPAFRHVKENEALQMDILTAASAVGVSCTFAAPIGGVLFSVEATSTYFAVRNYWRGFYSAMCGAFTFRLLSSITKSEETLTALFKTELRQTLPYDVFEILAFAFVGLVCGVLGAGFVWLHKNIVLFVRGQKWLNKLLKKSPVIYPCIITMLIFSITFPEGAGKYMAGQLTLREAINQMFDNRTWMIAEAETEDEERMLAVWKGPLDNVLLTIGLFFAMKFWMCAISTTLPFPCGIFIPAFALGSSVGRFMGEVMAHLCPEGIRGKMIVPGAYSLVGAATFSGAVTHTVSPAVIVFELTGHLGHLLPCMIAVMVAGAVANFLQPSVYDAMIEIKKLPFLQSTIDSQVCNAHNITAEDIMVREVECIPEETTFGEVWRIITQCKHRAYPVVASKDNPKLVGSVMRADLKHLLLRYLNCQSLVTPSPPPPSSSSLSTSEKIHPLLEQDEEKETIVPDDLLDQSVDIFTCDIDHAPFQIPSRTSLYRIHWLFSLLALHHAFVTEDGKIIGVLSLAEVRRAIQHEVNTSSKK